jgi:uncharacterized protein DUF6306
VDRPLEAILNLLLESERAGAVVLARLSAQVEDPELKQLLLTSKDDEAAAARELEGLLQKSGALPSEKVGPFAEKVMALPSLRERLNLLIHGEEWVARKVEEALTVAPPTGPIRDYLQKMARRHRFEVEWGRAELIRAMNKLG